MPVSTASSDLDMQIRLAAFAHLKLLGGDDRIVYWKDLQAGFEFQGERVFLVSQAGIFRPVQLRDSGAALTIRTSPPNSRYESAYDDQLRASDEFVHYRYRRGGPNGADNRALRRAMELRRPLVWLYGLSEGVYRAEFPVWVVNDLEAEQTFELAVDTEAASPSLILSGGSSVPLKAYSTSVAKRRLHQDRFRRMVIGAYRRECAVCALGKRKKQLPNDRLIRLLDAAHIVPDADEQGLPEIPNGLSLCKIHHSAYDLNILGISPDLLVHIREDILDIVDGPMLEHGIKGMSGRRIGIPTMEAHHPRADFLAMRYELFEKAS